MTEMVSQSQLPQVTHRRDVRGERWEWSDQRREALDLIATTDLTFQEIADRLGIARKTLHEWRTTPAFREELDALNRALAEETGRIAIAKKVERVTGYDSRRDLILRLIKARGEWYAENEPHVPGGDTGLLLKKHKSIGSGVGAYAISEYEEATALLRELRELEKQAAIEVGQWQEKLGIEADLLVAVGPPSVLRILDQPDNPDAPNQEAVEGVYRPVSESASDDDQASASDDELVALTARLVAGEIDRAAYDAATVRLRGR